MGISQWLGIDTISTRTNNGCSTLVTSMKKENRATTEMAQNTKNTNQKNTIIGQPERERV
jgi:hypothetical protein